MIEYCIDFRYYKGAHRSQWMAESILPIFTVFHMHAEATLVITAWCFGTYSFYPMETDDI